MNPPAGAADATGARPPRLAEILWGAALVSLAWVGVDPVALATGRDLGAGFQPSYLLLAGAICAWIPFGSRGARAKVCRLAAWQWFALVGLVVALASGAGLFLAPPPGVALSARMMRFVKQIVQLIVMMSFMSFTIYWTRGAGRWARVRDLFGVGCAIQIAWGLTQAVTFGHAPGWFVAAERIATSNPSILSGSGELFLGGVFTGIPRVRGTVCEPLYLANYALLALPVLLLPGSRRWQRAIACGAGVLLLLSWSRGAWLAAVVGVGVWAALAARARCLPRPGRRWWALVVVLVVIAVTAAALRPDLALLPGRRLLQVFNRADWSNLTRFYSMQAAWRAWLLSPWLGVGWGQFGFHFPALADPLGLQSQFSWPVVNNFPLAILCETGLLGFGVLAAAGAWLARASWRAVRTGAGSAAAGRVALLAAGTAAVWSQLLTFSQYNLPHIWVAPGLLLAALAEAREDRHG